MMLFFDLENHLDLASSHTDIANLAPPIKCLIGNEWDQLPSIAVSLAARDELSVKTVVILMGLEYKVSWPFHQPSCTLDFINC